MSVRLVVFDIGGVMIQICHSWSEAMETAGISGGIPDPDRLSQSPFLDDYQDGSISVEEYFRILGGHCGISPEQAREVHLSILRAEYPNLIPIVLGLKAAGIQTACLSNTADLHWQDMHRESKFPAFALLDFRFASHILKANKPAIEAYRAVEDAVGVRSSEVLFFEDTPRNIQGAQDAGWDVVPMVAADDAATQIQAALKARSIPGF